LIQHIDNLKALAGWLLCFSATGGSQRNRGSNVATQLYELPFGILWPWFL